MLKPFYLNDAILNMAFDEDSARGDYTTDATVAQVSKGKGIIKAKQDLIVCGTELIPYIFARLDDDIKVEIFYKDGDCVLKGSVIANVYGKSRAILRGERIVLNFLQRLSGIATLSAEYASLVPKESKTRIVDTRKTTPGWRMLEKYAVKIGGSFNHRFSLDDGILIKDNHIQAAGGITNAVLRVRSSVHHLLKIEVETTTLDEVNEALSVGADVVMLDNMNNEQVLCALKLINSKALVEVSGGITKDRIKVLAEMNVDFISVGALTHSAVSKDINLTLVAE